MKRIIAILMLAAAFVARAATPTSDTLLNVTLLPNSQYRVTANVDTNDANALLGLLLGGDNPLQILDGAGNVLGQADLQDLIDALTGVLGNATHTVEFIVQTGADTVTDAVERVLDVPGVTVSNVSVSAISAADPRPQVRITKRKVSGMKLKIAGTASDDGRVVRVEVIVNGKVRRAHGTTKWNLTAQAKPGNNRVVVRAFDDDHNVSDPKRVKMRAREE